jgi:hypothetical protein
MTDDQRQKVHRALEKAEGCRAKAAIILEINLSTLRQFIRNDEVLSSRWGGVNVESETVLPKTPTNEQVLHRIPLDTGNPHPTMGDYDIELALSQENKALRLGLKSLGLTTDQQAQAESLQKFTHNFFGATIELMHGGLVKSTLQMGIEKERTHNRLAAVQQELTNLEKYPYGSEIRSFLLEEETGLAKQLRDCGKEIIQSNEIMQRSAILAAMVGPRNGKPKKNGARKIGFIQPDDNQPATAGGF